VPEAQAAEPETASLGPLEPREEHGLLAGRYRGFTSAKKRMEKIKAQDLPAFVRSKGRFYEVWAGPFATTEEAQQARKSLNAVKISAKMGKLTIPVPK
ncbi:MAG: SPOR domain-containing protein, partial [Thermodesulfobacteriota bacterium]